MAVNSADAVKGIKDILQKIQNESDLMKGSIEDTAIQGKRQAMATEQIASSMQQLASTAANVEDILNIV